MSDLISRQDAIEAIASRDETDGTVKAFTGREVNGILSALPSADRPTTDCTKFLEWLKAEVLDEENWELNAVANGEVICRKFRKLGWLDVEDGYYVDTRPTVDKEYLIDLIQEAVYDGEACAKLIDLVDRPTGEWIPVSERLPDIGDTYLVTVMVGKEIRTDVADSFGSYIDGFWDTFNDWIEGEECHVIAWMPLPEPYKGGDSE